jgi:hypothetical protein
MRFGRSRVQDRAGYSDVETVIEDPSAEISNDASEAAPAYESSHFVDSHTITNAEGSYAPEAGAVDAPEVHEPGMDEDDADAIDELRAATTAAGAPTIDITPEQSAEIYRLHEVTDAAKRRASRILATPAARRRLHDAVTEESDALHMLGFVTFEEFAIVCAATPTVVDQQEDNAETIARIAEILAEIGIDPSADPLEAAREFLATHEDDLLAPEEDAAPAATLSPYITWADPPVTVPVMDETAEPEMAETAETDETDMDEELAPAYYEPSTPVEVEAPAEPEPQPDAEEIPSLLEAASAIDMAASRAEAAVSPTFEAPEPAAAEIHGRDEEIVDRWISAEARAERMHAEVDRAQAELVALLARSAELESSVVERVNERDTAHADLEQARARVDELEQSIVRSDSERAEIDAALSTSRDRIAELELVAADREQAYAQSEHDRVAALDTVAELEASLSARSAELEQARAAATALEAEIAAQAQELAALGGELDLARSELGSTRADMAELRTVLESTRRSVDALDHHAEAIENELAEARRKAESPEGRQQLEAVRAELTNARNELVELEARRTETETMLARDHFELERLQKEIATTRELTATARSELSAARNAFEATSASVEAAQRAREAITIDAADLLARAEADAANVLERAARDADAIRQEARLEHPGSGPENDALTRLGDQVARMERKLSKQIRKLAKRAPVDTAPAAEREAMEVRRTARADRERFREELIGLLSRLDPPAAAADENDDYY